MSAPAFVWALEQGRELNLSTSSRMVLVYLADKANGHRQAWPCQETIADWTGLKQRAVRLAIRALEQAGVIRCTYRGKLRLYHILRPEGWTPANGAADTPANNAAETSTPANGAAMSPANGAGKKVRHRQNPTLSPAFNAKIPAPDADQNLLLTKKLTLVARDAREGKPASDQDSGEKASKPDVSPTWPPPKAPALGGTTVSGGAGHLTIPGRSSDAFLDDPKADDALPKAEADPLDAPVDPARLKALAANIARGFQNNYPPRESPFSRDEQITVCEDKPRIRTAYLPDEALRAQRLAFAARFGGATP